MQRPVEVLAVGDSPKLLAEVRASAEPLGARVREAPAGEEALRSLLYEPDVAAVVMDPQLAGMDGLETAAAIHARRKTCHVPILIVADGDGPDRRAEAYDAGAADYLVRPADATALRAKLSVFIDLHLLRRRSDGFSRRPLHDRLTALATRDLFVDRLEHALARSGRRPVPLAVLLIGLDDLERVNEDHGERAGDAVLVEAGRRLRTLVRHDDTVARYGGDEFTILAEDVGGAAAARQLGERVAKELARPYADGVEMSASVGVAFTSNPAGATADGLIRRADHAMYRSTRSGGGRAEVSRVRPGLLPASSR